MTAEAVDRRVARTEAALNAAFVQLLFSRDYNDITAADIAAQADVGRSTFYEHYKGKNDLLRHSLARPLTVLAEIVASPSPEALLPTLAHFRENRSLASVIFAQPVRQVMSRCLADLLEPRLTALARGSTPRQPVIPLSLVARQLAEAQLAILENWILGKVAASPAAIAEALVLSTDGLVSALLRAADPQRSEP
jgi:AcrR family transcriptional regulator